MAAVVSTVFLAIACLFTALRCYARFIMIRNPNFDDVFVVLACCSSVALTVLIWEERSYGLGQHIDTLTPDSISNYLKSFWASVICYCISLTLVKNSAIFQCLRFILIGRMRIFCWILVVIISIFGLVSITLNMFHCWPVQAFWDFSITNGKCIDLTSYWYFASAFCVVTDILVVVIPILTIKDMMMPRRQKIALIVVFALGGLACIASIVRVVGLVKLGKSPDITMNNVDAAMWSSLEVNFGIICVCIPPPKPMLVAVAPKLLGSPRQNGSTTDSTFSGETVVNLSETKKAKVSIASLFPAGEAKRVIV